MNRNATDGTKTVAVQEEDLLPKVTIALVSGAPTAYDEGEIVTFEISASPVTTTSRPHSICNAC